MKRLFLLTLLLAPVATAQVRVAGAPVPMTTPIEGLVHPTFSPDGRYVALTSSTYDGLWVRDLQTGTTRQLTDEPAAGFGASWSPDGTALLARVARFDAQGTRTNAVRMFDVPAQQSRLLTDYTSRMPTVPAWSADGANVLLASGDGLQRLETNRPAVSGKQAVPTLVVRHDALVRAADGAEVAVPLEGQAILRAVPSPDGLRVALHVMGAGLFVVNADGSGLTSLGAGEHPTWSPDGQWLAFMRVEDDGYEFTGADLFTVRPDGRDLSQLTFSADLNEMDPVWTPDGSAIAFNDLAAGVVYLLPVLY